MKYMHQGEKISLEELLQRRDERQLISDELSQRFPGSTIVFLTVNIPGPIKNNTAIARIFDFGIKAIDDYLEKNKIEVLERKEFRLKTGNEYVLATDADAAQTKRAMIDIENDGLGRLLDIDVISGGKQISRGDFGVEERKCFICNQNARLCARSRKHSFEELYSWIEEQIDACSDLN